MTDRSTSDSPSEMVHLIKLVIIEPKDLLAEESTCQLLCSVDDLPSPQFLFDQKFAALGQKPKLKISGTIQILGAR